MSQELCILLRQLLKNLAQDMMSHLDWVGVSYVRFPLRETIWRWTQAWLQLFLVAFVDSDGYARYQLNYHT